MTIPWGDTRPTDPGKKSKEALYFTASCKVCDYTATAQRQTKADRLVDIHFKKKHGK